MIVKIPIESCEHLKDISVYNHNYYKIPFEINGCNIILEDCDENYDSYTYFLGKETDGAFEDSETFFSCDYGCKECKTHLILDWALENVWLN